MNKTIINRIAKILNATLIVSCLGYYLYLTLVVNKSYDTYMHSYDLYAYNELMSKAFVVSRLIMVVGLIVFFTTIVILILIKEHRKPFVLLLVSSITLVAFGLTGIVVGIAVFILSGYSFKLLNELQS
jgi:hypothetical protein